MNEIPKEMQAFFNSVVEDYDDHMASSVQDYEIFYNKLAFPFPKTNDSIKILDLGAGTGIELAYIFEKAPNALITAIDLSPLMLDKLVEKYDKYNSQIKTITGSYLSLPIDSYAFDYVISVMSLHHLLQNEKISLYKKIRKTLSPKGFYIEGDYIVSDEEQNRLLEEFQLLRKKFNLTEEQLYHIDIPFSENTQINALKTAGFKKIEVLYRSWRSNIVVARTNEA